MPSGIAFTRSNRFELVSAELCRLFGRSEHELLGQPTQTIASRYRYALDKLRAHSPTLV